MRVQLMDRAVLTWETEQDLIDAGGTAIDIAEESSGWYRFYSTAAESSTGAKREALGMRFTNPNKGYVVWLQEAQISGGSTSFNWDFGWSYNATYQYPTSQNWTAVTADIDRTNLANFQNLNRLDSPGTIVWSTSYTQQVSSELETWEGELMPYINQSNGFNLVGGTGQTWHFWFSCNNAAWVYKPRVKVYEFNI